jgi:nicotinamide phosphoribosyltransferase
MNPFLGTDCYKMGHMQQYAPGVNKVYSYLMARSSKTFDKAQFIGFQYYLKEYLSMRLKPEMAEEFIENRNAILGGNSDDINRKIRSLANLGYFPLEIKAVEEGSILPVRNALMTITNTDPEFYWVVGFVESLLLKVWYPITVATTSLFYRETVEKFFKETVSEDQYGLKTFMVHDFGYRGDTSEEGAALSGMCHLANFLGSDTVVARKFAQLYYRATEPVMLSVHASEHSVMCSFGRENEIAGFENMLTQYPTGIVSIVSDTFNLWEVLTTFAEKLKPQILARNGKVVFRPDSGNPEYIICGDPAAPAGSHASKGAIRLLEEKFGSSVNSKGYKVLHPSVGLIYGDGMYLERYKKVLQRMKDMGYAASNLVIGVGGILRNHSRDTLGFAQKATYVEVNGESKEIEKDPITDPGKRSHKGLLRLTWDNETGYVTEDQVSPDEEQMGLLQTVFKDGQITREFTLGEIRERVNTYFEVKNG